LTKKCGGRFAKFDHDSNFPRRRKASGACTQQKSPAQEPGFFFFENACD